ncbi:MAG: hypothetical protein WA741_12740 [Candidatus Sulfotelmatobacter sp.]
MSTAPKMKPVKGAGKHETDALNASVTARPETGHRLALTTDWAAVLDSVGKLFERDACRSIDGMFEVHHQLHACIEHGAADGGDANLAFERAHQIVMEGFDKWMWKLREIAGATVTDLATIARGHPDWVTEDPASWARSHTKELLDGYLNGWRIPRIAIWFKQACDGRDLDFERYEHGRPEPWCAPTWVARSKDWTNDPASLDERLTPELTQKFLQTRRRQYDLSFEIWLKESEHTARISLAMQPATAEHGKVTAEPDQPVSENVPGDLGEWAERYLPELQRFASCVRAGNTLDVLRVEFESLFAEVIDCLPEYRQKRFFQDARGRRLKVADLMEPLAEVKHLSAATLMDHRKQYRHKSGTARLRRSVVLSTK